MADWRLIQARIRRARVGPDAAAKLTQLYDKTRDAMVAFELGKVLESTGQHEQAVSWYTSAAERFRRAEWKRKAEEALARLGAGTHAPAGAESAAEAGPLEEFMGPLAVQEILPPEASAEQASEPAASAQAGPVPTEAGEGRRRTRRGRRGGRRRRGRKGEERGAAARPAAESAAAGPVAEPRAEAPARPREHEPAGIPAAWQTRARTGEPALASRLAHLESQLRRLIASPLHHVEDSDQAPAGPGVLLLSDSDQITHYYIEACRTLRIALGLLLRGGRRDSPLKARLAEHLGISESRVPKYMKEHCAVRWLQLDDGAPDLAHFAIAVLRPVLND